MGFCFEFDGKNGWVCLNKRVSGWDLGISVRIIFVVFVIGIWEIIVLLVVFGIYGSCYLGGFVRFVGFRITLVLLDLY